MLQDLPYIRRALHDHQSQADENSPLNVVEFCLLPKVTSQYRQALENYRDGDHTTSLGQLAERYLPKALLDELKEFAATPGMNTVFVLRNFDEPYSAKHLQNIKYKSQVQKRASIRQNVTMKAHAMMLTTGIAEALQLTPHPSQNDIVLTRKANNKVAGHIPHQHSEHINMLAGVISDDAPTRFIDTLAASKGRHNQQMLEVTHHNGMIDRSQRMPLSDLAPKEYKEAEVTIMPVRGSNMQDFNTMLAEHGQEVVARKGDIILWANDGALFHQGMPASGHYDGKSDDINRIVTVSAYNRSR